jgi:hypothetical protein
MQHRSRRAGVIVASIALVASLIGVGAGGSAGAAPSRGPLRFVRHVESLQGAADDAAAARVAVQGGASVDDVDADMQTDGELYRLHRSVSRKPPRGGVEVRNGSEPAPVSTQSARVTTMASTIGWEGLNHFNSRYSGGGNAFSGEPADQGLCASNSYVFEIVNSVVQVYTPQGQALIDGDPFFPGTEPIGLTLNEFYGLPPAFVRPAGPFGPFMFDIACLYDPSTGRWFVTSADLEQDPVTGAFNGENGTYIAVSETSNPLGGWNIWFLNTVNNGTGGTPDHQCSGGYCFGDYPQIGMDANGFYISTNEFDLLLNGEFKGAQLYAFSKRDLVNGDPEPTMEYIETVYSETVEFEAYTMQPVNSIPSQRDTRRGGTMYFGMSTSPYAEASASDIVLWSLSNTRSLNQPTPNLALEETAVPTLDYVAPALAVQKDGPTPLLDCVNQNPCNGATYPHQTGPLPLNAGSSGKVYGAWLHGGNVYLTAGTLLQGSGAAVMNPSTGKVKTLPFKTGIFYTVLRPSGTSSSASMVRQGYVSVNQHNLTFPALAMNGAGKGAISATLVGPDHHPSAVVIPWNAGARPGDVLITGPGVGPWDGFTGTGEGGFAPRWGDYHTATVSPNGKLWLAAGYINQSCTSAVFNADTTCGFTRTYFANWSTHITGYTP